MSNNIFKIIAIALVCMMSGLMIVFFNGDAAVIPMIYFTLVFPIIIMMILSN
jgi:hypothetical protein